MRVFRLLIPSAAAFKPQTIQARAGAAPAVATVFIQLANTQIANNLKVLGSGTFGVVYLDNASNKAVKRWKYEAKDKCSKTCAKTELEHEYKMIAAFWSKVQSTLRSAQINSIDLLERAEKHFLRVKKLQSLPETEDLRGVLGWKNVFTRFLR